MDVGAVDLKRGLVGTAAIAATVAVVGIFGPGGLLASLCALFLGILAEPGPTREWLVRRGRFVLAGAVIVGLLSWAGDDTWSATLVAAAVTYGGTAAAGWGTRAGMEGQFLVLLTVITLMVGPTDLPPVGLAAGFAVGGVIATAVSLLGQRLVGDDVDQPAIAVTEAEHRPLSVEAMAEVARSEVGVFALIRGLAVAIATAVGYELFEEHPVWAMLTVVVVLQTPAQQTWSLGLQRTVGTFVGVALGMVVVQWLDTGTAAIVVAFVLAGFAMMAFKDVSYTLSTVFTTCVLLFSQRILQEDTFETGWQRMAATVLGSGIALVVVVIAVLRDPGPDRGGPAART